MTSELHGRVGGVQPGFAGVQSNRGIGHPAKSEFLANMSHEIRTPMTAILGYADLLLEENAEPCHAEHVEVIKRNGEHLLELINDILDLSKVEAGKMQIEPTRCSPCELLAEVVSLMRSAGRCEATEAKDRNLVGPLPETVLADPLRLRQVLVNLVGNAIKFTERGEVRITAGSPTTACSRGSAFDVTDTGIGMSQEQVGRLFRAFSQVDSSASRKVRRHRAGTCHKQAADRDHGRQHRSSLRPGRGQHLHHHHGSGTPR